MDEPGILDLDPATLASFAAFVRGRVPDPDALTTESVGALLGEFIVDVDPVLAVVARGTDERLEFPSNAPGRFRFEAMTRALAGTYDEFRAEAGHRPAVTWTAT